MPKFATVGTIEVATGWEDHLLLLLRAKSGLTPAAKVLYSITSSTSEST